MNIGQAVVNLSDWLPGDSQALVKLNIISPQNRTLLLLIGRGPALQNKRLEILPGDKAKISDKRWQLSFNIILYI